MDFYRAGVRDVKTHDVIIVLKLCALCLPLLLYRCITIIVITKAL